LTKKIFERPSMLLPNQPTLQLGCWAMMSLHLRLIQKVRNSVTQVLLVR
jgi:hypothetical protein